MVFFMVCFIFLIRKIKGTMNNLIKLGPEEPGVSVGETRRRGRRRECRESGGEAVGDGAGEGVGESVGEMARPSRMLI